MAHATSRGESDLLVLFWIFDTHRLPPSVFGAPPFPAALRTVVTPAPTALAICRQLSPAARSSRTVSRRNTFRGRPIGLPDLVPFRRAWCNPAMTRSRLRTRSCFAITLRLK